MLSKNKQIIVLLSAFIILGEVHNLVKSEASKPYDVFLFIDYKLDLEWIVKHVSEKLQYIMLAGALYLSQRGQLKKLSLVVLGFTVFDLIMYFVNFNSEPFYTVAYLIISAICYKLFK